MLLEGIFAAATTPFYPDGRIYYKKLEHNLARYSQTPVAGVVVLGSTGEAVMLSDEESREVLKIARDAAAPEKVLLAGVGKESVHETLRLADVAAELEYDAVLVRTPNFYSPQMGTLEMLTYFRTVADRSPLPVVIYSIPKFTRYDMPIGLLAELASHANIIGLKDSSGRVDRIAELVASTSQVPKRVVTVTPIFEAVTKRMQAQGAESTGTFVTAEQLGSGGTAVAIGAPKSAMKTRTREVGFQVLTGSAHQIKSSLDAGATGGVLAFAACAPQVCQEIYSAWKDRDQKLAEEKQRRITAASVGVVGGLGVPGVKYACELNGYFGGRPRLPLLSLNESQRAEVEFLMTELRN
jgi:dihydrodipicolinate synthase/N-acetylneuraminate lyase